MQLLKYNFRGYMSILIPSYILAAIASGLNILLGLFLEATAGKLATFVEVSLAVIYQVSLFTVVLMSVATAICVIVDFYRSVLGKEGYLIHTLPVKTTTVLASKVVAGTAVLWLSTIISVSLILIMGLFPNYNQLDTTYLLEYADSREYLFWFLVAGFATELLQLLCVFTSLSLGHLTKHRVGISVVLYLTFYHTLAAIPLFATIFTTLSAEHLVTPPNLALMYCGYSLVVSVGFYLVPRWVICNKLNLE